MYPIAFVLIIIGQIIYFIGYRLLGEAVKPWLGKNQERGVVGIFTAKKRLRTDPTAAAVVAADRGESDDYYGELQHQQQQQEQHLSEEQQEESAGLGHRHDSSKLVSNNVSPV